MKSSITKLALCGLLVTLFFNAYAITPSFKDLEEALTKDTDFGKLVRATVEFAKINETLSGSAVSVATSTSLIEKMNTLDNLLIKRHGLVFLNDDERRTLYIKSSMRMLIAEAEKQMALYTTSCARCLAAYKGCAAAADIVYAAYEAANCRDVPMGEWWYLCMGNAIIRHENALNRCNADYNRCRIGCY